MILVLVFALMPASERVLRADGGPLPLPDAGEVIRAFNTLDGWIRGWDVSTEPQLIDPPGTTGASVTLRLSGRVLGRGSAVTSDRSAMWRAARDAFVQSASSLPVDPDALRSRRIEEIAPRITIDLQVAGLMTPMLVENEAAVSLQLNPGAEGVAVRVGDRIEVVFPGTMLSQSTTPAEAVRIAMTRLGLPARPLAELSRSTGLVVYRFPVRHLVQPREQGAPEFLFRGGRVIASTEVTGPRLRESASLIASHIISHAWPGQEPFGMLGDYQTIGDRYAPHIAPPLDQAACALALARYSLTPGLTPREAGRARRFAAEVLGALALVAPEEEDPLADPLASAMWIGAAETLREIDADVSQPEEFRDRALGVVREMVNADGAWTAGAPPEGRSLVAWSLALASRRDEALRARAAGAVRSLFRETDPPRLVSEMPWLGWAELILAGEEGPIPAALALSELRSTAYTFQVSEQRASAESPDLLGGIMFTRARSSAPTWNTLRPLSFIATMLADPRLTPDSEVVPELARLRPSLRFLLQLMIDDPLIHMMRDRDRARGGVRTAVWDQTAALEPAAMALLCLSETLRAMEARGGRK